MLKTLIASSFQHAGWRLALVAAVCFAAGMASSNCPSFGLCDQMAASVNSPSGAGRCASTPAG